MRAFFLQAVFGVLIILDVFATFHSLSIIMCGDCQSPDYVLMAGEVVSIILLLFCNVMAIKGIRTNQPAHILPWLVVYMIGIITCYTGTVIIFARNMVNGVWNFQWFLPFTGGVVFSIIWFLAKSAYSDMNLDMRATEMELNPIILK